MLVEPLSTEPFEKSSFQFVTIKADDEKGERQHVSSLYEAGSCGPCLRSCRRRGEGERAREAERGEIVRRERDHRLRACYEVRVP
jgi:hypothetical protein